MNEQEEFLSPQQSKLINFAIWANYLAWIVLIFYIIYALLTPLFSQRYYQQMLMTSSSPNFQSFSDAISENPFYYLTDIFSDVIIVLLRGFVFYVVLKGVSLGSYMIVETDINYRENENQGRPS